MRTLIALAALSFSVPALAGPGESVRNLQGNDVSLESGPAVLAFWSMDCLSCVDDLRRLSRSGMPVVAINTDSAQARSQIPGWLRARDLQLDVVTDPTGRLQQRYQVSEGEGAVLTGVPQGTGWTVARLDDVDQKLGTPDCAAEVAFAMACGDAAPTLAGIIKP